MPLGKVINMLIEDLNCPETRILCLEIWLKITVTSVVESTLAFSSKGTKSAHINT